MKWFVTISIVIACLNSSAQFYTKFTADLKAALPSKHAVEKVIENYKALGLGAIFESGVNDNRVNFLELKCREYWIRHDEERISNRYPANKSELILYFSDDLIVHINFVKGYKTLLTYTDSALLDKQLSRMNDLYGASFERSKICEGFFGFNHTYDIFGIAWGLSRTTSPEVYEPMENIFKLVYSCKLDALIQLAKSSCIETKAYGAAGLYLLQQEECDILEQGIQLLEEIRESKEAICFAPGGCMIYCGRGTKDALTDYFLKKVRTRYLDFRSSQKTQHPIVY